jgi:hypothetical protein
MFCIRVLIKMSMNILCNGLASIMSFTMCGSCIAAIYFIARYCIDVLAGALILIGSMAIISFVAGFYFMCCCETLYTCSQSERAQDVTETDKLQP